jgi:hypothetical protein
VNKNVAFYKFDFIGRKSTLSIVLFYPYSDNSALVDLSAQTSSAYPAKVVTVPWVHIRPDVMGSVTNAVDSSLRSSR